MRQRFSLVANFANVTFICFRCILFKDFSRTSFLSEQSLNQCRCYHLNLIICLCFNPPMARGDGCPPPPPQQVFPVFSGMGRAFLQAKF